MGIKVLIDMARKRVLVYMPIMKQSETVIFQHVLAEVSRIFSTIDLSDFYKTEFPFITDTTGIVPAIEWTVVDGDEFKPLDFYLPFDKTEDEFHFLSYKNEEEIDEKT